MKKVAAAACLVLAGVVSVGCSGSSSKSDSTPSTASHETISPNTESSGDSTATTLAAATQAQLKSELVKVTDLPTGWSSRPVDNSSSSGSFCGLSSSFKVKSAANVEADFAKGDLPIFYELIASFHADITPTFDAAVKALDSCSSFKDQGQTFTLGRMSFPPVGDKSAAYSATGTIQGINVGFDIILIEKSNQAAVLLYGDLGTPDVNELQQLATLAIGRMP